MAGIDANAIVVLHGDGANGGTTFTDSAISPSTFSAVGNAQTSTTSPKFGTAAILLDGTSDGVSTPTSDKFHLWSGDCTLEAWVKRAAAGANHMICSHTTPTTTNPRVTFRITSTNKVELAFVSSTSAILGSYTTNAITFDSGTWYHLRGVKSGTTIYIFLDGVAQALTSENAGSWSYEDITGDFVVGLQLGAQGFNGGIDEFRLSNVARSTSNFTPQTEAYSLDATGGFMTTNKGFWGA